MKEKIIVKTIIFRTISIGILIPELFFVGILLKNINNGGRFSTKDVIFITCLICIPLFISAVFYIMSINVNEKRYIVVNIYLLLVFLGYLGIAINMLFFGYRNNFSAANFGRSHVEYLRYNSNFIPFHTVGEYMEAWKQGTMNLSIILENLLGNLLIFAPLGILLPSIFNRLRNWRWFSVTTIVATLCVEGIQFMFMLGCCDVDDVILNFLGAFIIFAMWKSKWGQWVSKKLYIIQ